MKALLLDGPRAGHQFEAPDYFQPQDTLAFPRPDPPAWLPPDIAALCEQPRWITYSLAAVGEAGAVYVRSMSEYDRAVDYAHDPELWPPE